MSDDANYPMREGHYRVRCAACDEVLGYAKHGYGPETVDGDAATTTWSDETEPGRWVVRHRSFIECIAALQSRIEKLETKVQ